MVYYQVNTDPHFPCNKAIIMKYLILIFTLLFTTSALADGIVPLGEVYPIQFLSRSSSTGAPTALSGTPELVVYEEGNSTPITTADSAITQSYNSVTGSNYCEITASGGNGFSVGKWYVVQMAGTSPAVDGVSIDGWPMGRFRVVAAETAAGTPAVDLILVDGAATSSGLLDEAGVAAAASPSTQS